MTQVLTVAVDPEVLRLAHSVALVLVLKALLGQRPKD